MNALSYAQKRMVQTSFAALEADVDATAAHFYGHLFEQDPAAADLFRNDMHAQGRKLMTTLKTIVTALDNLPALTSLLSEMARQHVGYGVSREHFRLAEESLLYAVAQMLADDYSEEIAESWQCAYRMIEDVIVEHAYAD